MAEHRQLAVRTLLPLPAAQRVPELARQRETVVVRRKPAARGGDRVDVVAPPARDAQHLVDREPGHLLARALHARHALFRYRGDELVVVERSRGRVVHAGVDGEDAQSGHLSVWKGGAGARAGNTKQISGLGVRSALSPSTSARLRGEVDASAAG